MLTRTTILEHVIEPHRGELTEELARYLLSLDFPPADHARYEELAAKAQEGRLSQAEQAELDDFLTVNDFLTIVQAKARVSIGQHGNSAA